MSINPTYPGVYIQEVPSAVRTIAGVSTSVTAFVGYTARGPTNTAQRVFNFSEYARHFGGLQPDSHVGYAVQQYFVNGGTEAWIVRIANGAHAASVMLSNTVAGVPMLAVEAANEGEWGNLLRVDVDHDAANRGSDFNLGITEYAEVNGRLEVQRVETHQNLSMDSRSSRWAETVVAAASDLVRVQRLPAAEAAVQAVQGTSRSGALTQGDIDGLDNEHRRLAVVVNGTGPVEFELFAAGGQLNGADLNARLTDAAARIEAAVRGLHPGDPEFSAFTCAADGATLLATSGAAGQHSSVRFLPAASENAAGILRLGFAAGGLEVDAEAAIRPAVTGTLGGDIGSLDLTALPDAGTIEARVRGHSGDTPFFDIELWTAADKPDSLTALATAVRSAFSTTQPVDGNGDPVDAPELAAAGVRIQGERLRITSSGSDPDVRFEFQGGLVNQILPNPVVNVGRYSVGVGRIVGAQTAGGVSGADGAPPVGPQDAALFIGNRARKDGVFALESVELFNLLCIPDESRAAVLTRALAYCEERRAFFIIDVPGDRRTVEEAEAWLTENGDLRHRNAAAYFPRVRIPDPANEFRLRDFPPSGTVAGLYARTDSTRGVWKAPAGIEARLRGVRELSATLSDRENGVLNPQGLNCLRSFSAYGRVSWGARTLVGNDASASQWKYVPVRRLALYIEESVFRGIQWAVFEPNDEPLWSQLRLNVGTFMHGLFRQQAFQGASPREAYLVKCDSETTTQADIDRGIVNLLVGFAPLKPAEFVILRISQLAGQVEV